MIHAGNCFHLPPFRICWWRRQHRARASHRRGADCGDSPFQLANQNELFNAVPAVSWAIRVTKLGILQRKLMIKDRASPSLNREGARVLWCVFEVKHFHYIVSRIVPLKARSARQNGSGGKLGLESQSESRFLNRETENASRIDHPGHPERAHPGLNSQKSQTVSG